MTEVTLMMLFTLSFDRGGSAIVVSVFVVGIGKWLDDPPVLFGGFVVSTSIGACPWCGVLSTARLVPDEGVGCDP